MKATNKLIALLLSLAMLIAAFPAVSLAAEADDLAPYTSPIYYADDIGVLLPVGYDDVSVQAEEDLPAWVDEAVATVREAMTKRVDTIEFVVPIIPYTKETVDTISGVYIPYIFRESLRHTGKPTEGDYILRHLYSYGSKFSPNNTTRDSGDVSFAFTWYTDEEQENTVDAKADELLKSLDLEGKNEYEKFKSIYDWICANIKYDDDNLNNKDYNLKYTAYAALVNKTSVCQGYASLLYRLLLAEGIDCRVIPGIGNGGRHAWNIVKLGDKYYNVDSTWDASCTQGGNGYQYFLLNEKNFTKNGADHIRQGDNIDPDDYTSAEFNALYPMSETDFDPSTYVPTDPDPVEPDPNKPDPDPNPVEPDPDEPAIKVTGVTLDPTELTLTVGESSTLNAVVEPADATDKSLTWSTSNSSVATVVDGTVTAVGPGTAYITVRTNDSGFDDTCTVTVEEPKPLAQDCAIKASFEVNGGGGLMAIADIIGGSGYQGPAAVIAAAYKDNVLVDVNKTLITLIPGEPRNYHILLDKAGSDCEIKIFVWKSLDGAISLGKAASCKVTAE